MATKKITIKKIKTKEDIITDKVDAIRNNLLGSYDDDGNYYISTQIAAELKRLTKLKKTVFNNSLFCVSNKLGYGEIVFEITFEKNTEENVAIAKLYVLESVYKVNGYLQNTIKTQIEEFKSTIENFINKSYDYYKVIVDPNEDEGREKKDITDEIFNESFILAKKQYSLAMDKLTEEKYNEIYAKLFARRIEVLKGAHNEFSAAILNHFNGEYELIEEYFLKDKNYKALNDLLDNSVEFLSGTDPVFEDQEKQIEEQLVPVYEQFEEEAEKIEDKFEFKAFSLLSKKDKEILKELKKEDSSKYKQSNTELKEQEVEVEVEEQEENTPPTIDDNMVQLAAKDVQEEIARVKEVPQQRQVEEKDQVENIDDKNIEEKPVQEEVDENSSDEMRIADISEDQKTHDLQDEIERITKEAEKEADEKLDLVDKSDEKPELEDKSEVKQEKESVEKKSETIYDKVSKVETAENKSQVEKTTIERSQAETTSDNSRKVEYVSKPKAKEFDFESILRNIESKAEHESPIQESIEKVKINVSPKPESSGIERGETRIFDSQVKQNNEKTSNSVRETLYKFTEVEGQDIVNVYQERAKQGEYNYNKEEPLDKTISNNENILKTTSVIPDNLGNEAKYKDPIQESNSNIIEPIIEEEADEDFIRIEDELLELSDEKQELKDSSGTDESIFETDGR